MPSYPLPLAPPIHRLTAFQSAIALCLLAFVHLFATSVATSLALALQPRLFPAELVLADDIILQGLWSL